MQKGFLRNFTKFTRKHLCQSLFFKKETLAQVLPCKFCKISKKTFFKEDLWTTAFKFIKKNSSFISSQFFFTHCIVSFVVCNFYPTFWSKNDRWNLRNTFIEKLLTRQNNKRKFYWWQNLDWNDIGNIEKWHCYWW